MYVCMYFIFIFFLRLQDNSDIVRFSALKTLIDLINQEMIKVRGQSAYIAKLLVDENKQIKSIFIILSLITYYLT